MKCPYRVRGILAVMLVLLCPFAKARALATPRRGKLELIARSGGRLYLRQGKAQLLLEGRDDVVTGPRGWTLRLPPTDARQDPVIRVFQHDKLAISLSLNQLRDNWLKQDDLWGPGKAGNEMRYMHRSGGGVGGFADEVYATSAGWVGILNWRFFGPSGEPVGPRHLFYLPAAPGATLRPVSLLHTGERRPYQDPNPRLLSTAGRLLLWDAGELTEIGAKGERLRRFMTLPDNGEPQGMQRGRWLLRQLESDVLGTRIDAVDLQHKKTFPLFSESANERRLHGIYVLDFDEATETLLLKTRMYQGKADHLSLLPLRSGKQRFLRTPWAHRVLRLWTGLLIGANDTGYFVCNARTLTPIQRLRRPTPH